MCVTVHECVCRVCEGVCVRVHACVHACMHVYVKCACVYVCGIVS